MTTAVGSATQLELDVRAGLCQSGQKTLPSKYLYTPMGSTLFEAICLLPEYGLTRAEERILRRHSSQMASHLPAGLVVAELGSGSGRKTSWILRALEAREPVTYYPIEISRTALEACEAELGKLPGVSIVQVEREYLDGLREVANERGDAPLLVLFLGSTIGNFAAGADAAFLSEVRAILGRGDSLLLGADLLKSPETMIAAYDDAIGVTAAFNLSMLVRINQELDADFDPREFRHEARFNRSTSNIEMHLVSKKRQNVRCGEFTVQFESGESIWTEACHKYTLSGIEDLAASSGFQLDHQWVDNEWPFADSLFRAV